MPTQIPRAWVNNMAKKVNIKSNENANANETIENIQKALENQIETFESKTRLIGHRKRFLVTKSKLEDFLVHQGSDYDEFLEDSSKKVIFTDKSRYTSDSAISISNNLLVREFAEFLILKIEAKISELEKEIIA